MALEIHSKNQQHERTTSLATPLDNLTGLLARDITQVGVMSIDRKEPVQKALALLIERNISGLPVTGNGRLEGMLSENDLLKLLYEGQYLPGLVEGYMTSPVTSFDVEDKLSMIHEYLGEHSFRRVPILYQGRLAGMITRADLVRVVKERFRSLADGTGLNDPDELLAEDAMKFGLLTLYPDDPLYDAMDLIARRHVTGLPIVDRGVNLLGIITEKDVLRSLATPEASDAPVETFMTRDVVTFDRRANLYEICACLIENDFHRVPIMDGTRLMGIISRSDILRHGASVWKR